MATDRNARSDLGAAIRAERARRALTQDELGSGMDPPRSRRWVSRLESGDESVVLTVEAAEQLRKILRINVGEYLAAEQRRSKTA